jgi:kynureninase
LGQPNYLTGQAYDVEALAPSAHDVGALIGLDLAHGIGNLPLELNRWNIDFAVWCSYKYLNAGPGGLAGAFVHRNHHGVALPRLEGWWGHHKPSRFEMPDRFVPIGGAETWQLSNPPIFQAASLRASLSVFNSVDRDTRVARSRALTQYLEHHVHAMGLDVITLKARGAQLSVRVGDHAEAMAQALAKRGVIVDVRPPDLIRMSPVALYNTFAEIDHVAEVMHDVLAR